MGKYNKFIIAGPCVIESESQVMEIAEKMKELTDKYNFHYIFKASFDKANRTSINSFRGPGIENGLQILKKVKDTFNVEITTDIHEAWQAEAVAPIKRSPILLLRVFMDDCFPGGTNGDLSFSNR